MNGLVLLAVFSFFFVVIPGYAAVTDYLKVRSLPKAAAFVPPEDVDAKHRKAIANLFAPRPPGVSK